jgi:hypothetical protein
MPDVMTLKTLAVTGGEVLFVRPNQDNGHIAHEGGSASHYFTGASDAYADRKPL